MAENQNGDGHQMTEQELETKELTLPEVDTNNVTPEKLSELQGVAKSALAQKQHWRGKAIDPTTGRPFKELFAEAQAKLSDNKPPAIPAVDTALKADVERLKLSEEKRTFGFEQHMSPDETDRLFAYSAGIGKKPLEVLQDDKDTFWKAGLAAMQAQKRNDSATLGPSNRTPRVEGKSWDELKPEEREKNFSSVVQGLNSSRRR